MPELLFEHQEFIQGNNIQLKDLSNESMNALQVFKLHSGKYIKAKDAGKPTEKIEDMLNKLSTKIVILLKADTNLQDAEVKKEEKIEKKEDEKEVEKAEKTVDKAEDKLEEAEQIVDNAEQAVEKEIEKVEETPKSEDKKEEPENEEEQPKAEESKEKEEPKKEEDKKEEDEKEEEQKAESKTEYEADKKEENPKQEKESNGQQPSGEAILDKIWAEGVRSITYEELKKRGIKFGFTSWIGKTYGRKGQYVLHKGAYDNKYIIEKR